MKIHKACQIEKCVSADHGRWILQQVQLRELDGKPVAVASNGWALAVVPVEAEQKEYGLVSTEALKAARKYVKDKRGHGYQSAQINCNGTLSIPGTGRELDRPEGSYPDVAPVIPNEGDGYKNVIAIDARALLAIQEAMGCGGVILCIKDELHPMIVKPASNNVGIPEPKAFGVLCPTRMS